MNEKLQKIITQAVKATYNIESEPHISPTEPEFGDFATNIAFELAGQLGRPPQAIAAELAEVIKGPELKRVEVAGPGFINLTLSDEALWKLAETPVDTSLTGQSIVVEYSDPNPFKVLHAGHLYTTITGDVIARLLEKAGATVHRINYGGDVGLHVARTMWAIIKKLGGEYPDKLEAVEVSNRLEWLAERYVEGTQAYEDDESAKAEIINLNQQVYKIQAEGDHDSAVAQIYWTGRTWSYEGFDQLYKQLEIHPFERTIPESEVTPTGIDMVRQGLEQGVFEQSDGAVVFKGEAHGLHTRVFMNSAGLPTYEAKDLGLAAIKWRDYQFDRSIIVTANDIVEYMKVVIQALSHFYPEVALRTQHLTHGVVKLQGGVKMSSRKGNILRLSDVLEAATEASKQVTGADGSSTVLAAVKFAFLKQRIGGDIIYDPLESVNILGNSGPYLQYAHARARSILAKATKTSENGSPIELEADERRLLQKLGRYQEVVNQATEELLPHLICTYLYELAQGFNRFYEANRVVGDQREAIRAKLVVMYADTLASGLDLLGIEAPDRV